MVQITLPDGSQRDYPAAVTVADVAASIGSGLAKAALAGKVNGKIVDRGTGTSTGVPRSGLVHAPLLQPAFLLLRGDVRRRPAGRR